MQNTPEPDCSVSSIEIVFGHPTQDSSPFGETFLKRCQNKYNVQINVFVWSGWYFGNWHIGMWTKTSTYIRWCFHFQQIGCRKSCIEKMRQIEQ